MDLGNQNDDETETNPENNPNPGIPGIPPITNTKVSGCKGHGLPHGGIGTIAHLQIQLYFLNQFPGSSRREYNIPQSSLSGGSGRADIVLLDEGIRFGHSQNSNYAGIYEIKPYSNTNEPMLSVAQAQRDRYVQNFHRSRVGGDATSGIYWQPINLVIGSWTLDPRQELVVDTLYGQPNHEGLVFYWCRNKASQ